MALAANITSDKILFSAGKSTKMCWKGFYQKCVKKIL